MIAKIIKGTSFSGVITYMLGKREGMARILDGEGVRVDATSNEIAGDFNLQASMRPNIKKPVCHTILSFSSEDSERLDDDKMVDIAREYLSQMGYSDTQYLIVRRMDREHPDLHICINRVDNYGNTISDRNEKFRSTKICRELTDKYLLKLGEGKTEVKRNTMTKFATPSTMLLQRYCPSVRIGNSLFLLCKSRVLTCSSRPRAKQISLRA